MLFKVLTNDFICLQSRFPRQKTWAVFFIKRIKHTWTDTTDSVNGHWKRIVSCFPVKTEVIFLIKGSFLYKNEHSTVKLFQTWNQLKKISFWITFLSTCVCVCVCVCNSHGSLDLDLSLWLWHKFTQRTIEPFKASLCINKIYILNLVIAFVH